MHVVSKRGLFIQARKHPETIGALDHWYRVARKAAWEGLHQVRLDFPSADQVGAVLIFNVLGGRYRLITTAVYRKHRIYVKSLLTHREYDRKEWMKWV